MTIRSIILLLLCLLAGAAFPEASVDVPLDHPVYRFISTLNFPSIIGNDDYSIKPYSEAQIIRLLNHELSGNPAADRETIERFIAAMDPYAGKNNLAVFKFGASTELSAGKNRDTLAFYPVASVAGAWQDSNYSRLGFRSWGFDSLSATKEAATMVKTGGVMRGGIAGMALYFKGHIITQHSTEMIWRKSGDPRHGAFFTTILAEDPDSAAHLIGYDDFTAYAKFSLPYFDLKVGRDRVAYGFSEGSGLLLSGRADPFFNVQISKNIGKLGYHFVWGRLLADTYDQKRYLYAKRIHYQPFAWLSLGFSDEAVSINRDLEPVYFLPMVPYYFSEHYLGDPDNRLMAFDARLTLARRAGLYAELLMDDMRDMLGLFDDQDISNKWGTVVGISVSRPVPGVISGARLEFTQIEPWVYTTSAKDNRGIYNYPVHFGSVLGNPLGPNSRALEMTLTGPYFEKINMSLSAAQIWKGLAPGSLVYDLNPYLTDPVTGRITRTYTKKEDRFSPQGVNRTVIRLDAEVQPYSFNRYDLSLGWTHERAIQPGDYFQASLSAFLNF